MTTRPNVVVILADDLGFSDLGCYGGEIDTPNLDRLAADGVRMSAFYTTPRCSPSRAALLTGRHPHSVGIGVLTSDDRPNGYRGSLAPDAPTLAELLRERGYATALIGKWHLSSQTTLPDDSWPTRRGFDEFYGILPGCASYYQPPLVACESPVQGPSADDDYYLTDDLSDHAVDVIRGAAAQDRPFFLYLAYTAPHWPLHAPDEVISRYRSRYREGWDALRQRRAERLRSLGILPDARPGDRDPEVGSWSEQSEPEWQVERMATYAAQVEIMDSGVGRVLDALEAHGIRDNTIVVFTSDNGACAEDIPPHGRPLGSDICPPLTRDGRAVAIGNRPEIRPGPEEGYASYGRGWANLSNTPFRLYKRWVHEGGIASPLIVSWPDGGIDAGGLSHHPAHVVEIAPSIVSLIDGSPAADAIVRAWRDPGARDATAQPLFWEHIGNAAVRRGRWKLVREWGGSWELYDMVADRGETEDLAAEHPDMVAELRELWSTWAASNGVLEWDAVLADYRARGRDAREAVG